MKGGAWPGNLSGSECRNIGLTGTSMAFLFSLTTYGMVLGAGIGPYLSPGAGRTLQNFGVSLTDYGACFRPV